MPEAVLSRLWGRHNGGGERVVNHQECLRVHEDRGLPPPEPLQEDSGWAGFTGLWGTKLPVWESKDGSCIHADRGLAAP